MSQTFGTYGRTAFRFSGPGYKLIRLAAIAYCKQRNFFQADSRYAQERGTAMQEKLRRGEPVYLLGIGPGGHNSGVALLEVTAQRGIRVLLNNEEERFTGTKHCSDYPEQGVNALLEQMETLGLKSTDIHACIATWDYVQLPLSLGQLALQELPHSLSWLYTDVAPDAINIWHVLQAYRAPKLLGQQLGMKGPMPIIGMRHHDNHATFSYGVSPFARSGEPTLVIVLDSFGDDGSVSVYLAREGKLEMLFCNNSFFDSLGMYYSILSSTQGGWTILSSEGRYMGAAAWGNNDRLTNPYYLQLRQLFYFATGGRVFINRKLANWPRRGPSVPYTQMLIDLIGPPISPKDMWNPDAVLRVEDVTHAETNRDRLDKAAAVQLVFEDVLFHLVGHYIRETGASQLVFSGGTALNCIANMHLLEHFNEDFYARYLGKKGQRLHMWVPPTPGDAGVTMGAAYNFAMSHGASVGEPLQHAYYCGRAPTSSETRAAIENATEISHLSIGDLSDPQRRAQAADLLAFLIASNSVVGIFQGAAETGPRALGHRSILATPCNPETRTNLNARVKFREAIRPLAPMATLEAAQRWFYLDPGASDDNYNAYNYMVLTARARPEALAAIPAVIHHDGTGRLQIVREQTEPFIYAYLKAMGKRAGVEVSVNTSLNVGGPIVQHPAQALETLKRAKGMECLFMIAADGQGFIVWHKVVDGVKDGGTHLKRQIDLWSLETGVSLT